MEVKCIMGIYFKFSEGDSKVSSQLFGPILLNIQLEVSCECVVGFLFTL